MQLRKIILLAGICSLPAIHSYAQGGITAGSQYVSMPLSNVLEISFKNTNSSGGAPLSMEFDDEEDFEKGIETPEQELMVRTNKAFNVNVKSKTGNFNYSGPESENPPSLPVDNTLSMAITANKTGGSTAQPENEFFGLNTTPQSVINHGGVGNNQSYSVKYKAKPDGPIPDGTYAVDIIYTASQE